MAEQENAPFGFDQEERLPWLEPIDDVDESGTSIGRLIGLVLIGLVCVGVVVGGLWWWQNSGGRPRGELIAAPAGDYKEAPKAEPGRFDGDGNSAVAASEGVTPQGRLDTTRVAEAPKAPPPSAAPPAPRTAPIAAAPAARTGASAAAPARPAPAPAPAPAFTPAIATAAPGGAASATSSGMIQLGAFSSEASALRAWTGFKGRFAWLASVNQVIVPAQANGRTIYRLRAAAGSARAAQDLCNRFRVAGETCNVVP